ncbi:hypothetical protein V8G54_024509 [Vigna mungo]|uniref:Uncharacterized protein n=1 Tax=Vigna mungo TaxID=3915 RepID=A0AAQ3N7J4_VIGMU
MACRLNTRSQPLLLMRSLKPSNKWQHDATTACNSGAHNPSKFNEKATPNEADSWVIENENIFRVVEFQVITWVSFRMRFLKKCFLDSAKFKQEFKIDDCAGLCGPVRVFGLVILKQHERRMEVPEVRESYEAQADESYCADEDQGVFDFGRVDQDGRVVRGGPKSGYEDLEGSFSSGEQQRKSYNRPQQFSHGTMKCFECRGAYFIWTSLYSLIGELRMMSRWQQLKSFIRKLLITERVLAMSGAIATQSMTRRMFKENMIYLPLEGLDELVYRYCDRAACYMVSAQEKKTSTEKQVMGLPVEEVSNLSSSINQNPNLKSLKFARSETQEKETLKHYNHQDHPLHGSTHVNCEPDRKKTQYNGDPRRSRGVGERSLRVTVETLLLTPTFKFPTASGIQKYTIPMPRPNPVTPTIRFGAQLVLNNTAIDDVFMNSFQHFHCFFDSALHEKLSWRLGDEKNMYPDAKKTNSIIPIVNLHSVLTFSVSNTKQQVEIDDRQNPIRNFNTEYIQTLVEKMMMMEITDIDKQDRTIMFFLPRDVSAMVARRKEPRRQPKKKEDWGKPVMKLLAHSRPNCEMIVLEEGPSHSHEDF